MNSRQRRRPFAIGRLALELEYIVLSLLFAAAGMGAVWLVHSVLEVEGDAILVAFLLLPVLLYLILSGRVYEIGAGSLSVKLRELAREPAEYVTADLGPTSDPNNRIAKTDPNRPQVVTLTHGGGPYERTQVLRRLEDLAAMTPVPLLIVLDYRKRVLAYMTYRSAIDLLERKERGDQFVKLVNDGGLDAFEGGGGFSAIKTETLSNDATNADALATMEETRLDELVVVDRRGLFEGIVERDRVLSRMMLALVSSHSS